MHWGICHTCYFGPDQTEKSEGSDQTMSVWKLLSISMQASLLPFAWRLEVIPAPGWVPPDILKQCRWCQNVHDGPNTEKLVPRGFFLFVFLVEEVQKADSTAILGFQARALCVLRGAWIPKCTTLPPGPIGQREPSLGPYVNLWRPTTLDRASLWMEDVPEACRERTNSLSVN